MVCSQNPTMSHASFLQIVKKRLPKSLKSLVIQRFPKLRWKGDKTRIFCIALQKTGTTSVGDFFTYFGYPTARYKHSRDNAWTRKWFDGDYEAIFDTEDFKQRQVFEDDPWWCLDFYKYLYHRFPNARFILVYRDPDRWFDSMLKHHDGKNLSNARHHCKMYHREADFYEKLEQDPNFRPSFDRVEKLIDMRPHREHYTTFYKTRQKEVLEFFEQHDRSRLLSLQLEAPGKWQQLGAFVGVKVPEGFDMHSNASEKH